MLKFTKILAFATILSLAAPIAAFAHGNGLENGKGLKLGLKLHNGVDLRQTKHYEGKVTATSATGFTLLTENKGSFTVTTSEAKITDAFGAALTLGSIHVNDNASVKGVVNGTTINAKLVVVTPANTHRAEGGGKVTAVSGNQITVQQNNHGIISSFTVNTNASTVVIGTNNNTTTTSSILVGSKIRVKGLWDEVLNVLNAIKIKIVQ
jgi:hypothetical protein